MIEQLLVHQIAATLTAAVVGNLPDNLPVDPEINAPELRGANLLTWNTHKIFYAAIAKSLGDATWAPVQGPGIIDGLAQQILPAISGQGPLGAILAPLIAKFLGSTTVKPTSGPIPNPGA